MIGGNPLMPLTTLHMISPSCSGNQTEVEGIVDYMIDLSARKVFENNSF